MPLYFSLPLPGPFRYTTRIGRRRRQGGSDLWQAAFWVLIGWWLIAAWIILKWTVIGLIWLCVFCYTLARGTARLPRIHNGRITVSQ